MRRVADGPYGRRPDHPGSGIDAALADLRDESEMPRSATLHDVRRIARAQDLSWLESMWFELLAVDEGLVAIEVPPPLPWYQPSSELHSFAAWMRSAQSFPLLTPDSVVRMTRAYEVGRSAARRLERESPPDPEARHLKVLVWRGLLARDALIYSNLRLVRSIAVRRRRPKGMEFVDVLQSGVLGLMRAVELFDWRRGLRFSTYATHWIQQSIGRELDNNDLMIGLPVHVHIELRRVERERIRQVLGREPADTDVAPFTVLEPQEERRLRSLQDVVPLDEIRSREESGNEWRDRADSELSVEDHGLLSAMAAELRRALARLDPRLQEVLRLRFGLDGGEELALRPAGKLLGLSGERVRILERDALALLRAMKDLSRPPD